MAGSIYDPDYVKGLFDRMSGSYERMNYITSFGFSIRWRKLFLKRVANAAAPVQAIDLLTGMGEAWNGIHELFPDVSLTALDFSPEMIRKADLKNRRSFQGSIHLLQEDVLNNSLPDAHFDLVSCAFGLKTFDESQLRALAGEIRRILKPGGRFTFIEVSQPPNRLLNACYGFYLGSEIPVLGLLFLGNPAEYRMLWVYTKRFVNAHTAARIFGEEGLTNQYQSYFYGCASGFSGRKADSQ